MIIDDLDLESVAVAVLEADSPRAVDRHGPLVAAGAFQLMKPDALQGTLILQPLRGIQRQQQIDRLFAVAPAKLGRTLALPTLAGCGAAP